MYEANVLSNLKLFVGTEYQQHLKCVDALKQEWLTIDQFEVTYSEIVYAVKKRLFLIYLAKMRSPPLI